MKAKPKFRVGQKVRYRSSQLCWPRRYRTGTGKITRVYPKFGNVPTNYEVNSFTSGVLFEDELRAVK